MPKLPDDMSDDAIARRAKMSSETKYVPPTKGRPATEAELAEYRAKHGLEPDAVVFLCRR